MQIVISSIAGVASFMLLDYLWLAHIAKHFYLSRLTTHITLENGSLVPYMPAVPIVYILAIISIFVFVLDKNSSWSSTFLHGALLGLLMYAFYDFTNLAIFRDYPWSIVIVDSLWGAFIMGVVSVIMWYAGTLIS